MESLLELRDLVVAWEFLPVGLVFLLLFTVGSGAWKPRWRKTFWMLGFLLLGASFAVGIQRHEWGEVLFNGQLL
jgi:hypothetical protein